MAPPQYFLDLCDLFDLLTLTMVKIQQNGCIFLLFSPIRSFWAIDGQNRLTSTSNSFLSIRVTFSPDGRKMGENWGCSKKSATRWIILHAKAHHAVGPIFANLTFFVTGRSYIKKIARIHLSKMGRFRDFRGFSWHPHNIFLTSVTFLTFWPWPWSKFNKLDAYSYYSRPYGHFELSMGQIGELRSPTHFWA